MASTWVAASLQVLWTVWNIRGFMILSLSMQFILSIISPLRKRTSICWVIMLIWSSYFLAGWAPKFAFASISNAKCWNSSSNLKVDQNLLTFWSSFLLIHMGGPDSIIAYALEDSTLWLRHLVGILGQVLVSLNIYVKTLPDNEFGVPSILIAVAGTIKYGERITGLYLGGIDNLKESTVKLRRLGLNNDSMRPEGAEPQCNLDGSNYNPEIRRAKIKKAFHYFETFKGLIINMMPSYSQWLDSRGFFLQQDARMAYEIITMELMFFYEIFYTKILTVNSALGMLIRGLAFGNILVALIMFCLMKKEGINGVDVGITYLLLAGAIAVEFASVLMLLCSNWLGVDPTLICVDFISGICCRSFAFRRWSESTGALNLLTLGFKDSCTRKVSKLQDYDKINDKKGVVVLTKLRYQWENKLDMDLWDFIFNCLWRKASPAVDADKVRKVYEARGDVALRDGNFYELKHYVEDFEFEKSLLVWHCATEICYRVDVQVDEPNNKKRIFSKILSDYMTYLLIKQPKLMSPMAGIEQIRYHDTRVEAKNIGLKHPPETMEEFCKNILEDHMVIAESDDRKGKGMSVLSEACNLANALKQRSRKWDTISKVWVEMLSYAATHSRADSHASLLSKGGEFITIVWLLMAHFGILPRFPKER